jgi:Flp pilus assembly protein TadG
MKFTKDKKGQILIETALVLVLLLVILLGITEFARAWFTKNSLKNAVRQGARVAVVTPGISDFSQNSCPSTCPTSKPSCTSQTNCNNQILYTVCCESPGMARLRANTSVTLNVVEGTFAATGNTIVVSANYANPTFFIVGGEYFNFLGVKVWPWSKALEFTVAKGNAPSASMRYE